MFNISKYSLIRTLEYVGEKKSILDTKKLFFWKILNSCKNLNEFQRLFEKKKFFIITFKYLLGLLDPAEAAILIFQNSMHLRRRTTVNSAKAEQFLFHHGLRHSI